jgi:hypothetical protein
MKPNFTVAFKLNFPGLERNFLGLSYVYEQHDKIIKALGIYGLGCSL